MLCIAITRNGYGQPWKFSTVEGARDHALVQYDDVILSDKEALLVEYTRKELQYITGFLGTEPRAVQAKTAVDTYAAAVKSVDVKAAREALAYHLDTLWDSLVRVAKAPPDNYIELLKVVKEDRRATLKATNRMRAWSAAVAPPGRPQTSVEDDDDMSDEKKRRDPFRMSDQGTISFGKDETGKSYGPDNNPKRGENTTSKFSTYTEGMTVAEAMEAGLTRSDIRRDRRKGFIVITNPPEAEKPAAAEATDGEAPKRRGRRKKDTPAADQSEAAEAPEASEESEAA